MKIPIPDWNGEGYGKTFKTKLNIRVNRVWRFLDMGMGTGLNISYPSRPKYSFKYIIYKYNKYLFLLKKTLKVKTDRILTFSYDTSFSLANHNNSYYYYTKNNF